MAPRLMLNPIEQSHGYIWRTYLFFSYIDHDGDTS